MKINQSVTNNDEITIKDIIYKVKRVWSILYAKKLVIILAGLIGGLLGFYYAFKQPVKYKARLTFVLEESKGGGGGIASLAGQFGFDVGGGGSGGLFTGDNIILFLQSQALVRETLLTSYDGSDVSLADKYSAAYGLTQHWSKKGIEPFLFSSLKNGGSNRLKDSLLQTITEQIAKKELFVQRPDKKASFIEVSTLLRDERLAKLFCDRLVSVALEKYVASKIKVKSANVKILQRRADSLEVLLNARTYTAANSQQTLLDINPGIRSMSANPEIRNREKLTAQTIYGEVVKNLELAKTLLSQETPAIEIVDESYFPLKKEKLGKLQYLVLGSLVTACITSLFILLRIWFRKHLQG